MLINGWFESYVGIREGAVFLSRRTHKIHLLLTGRWETILRHFAGGKPFLFIMLLEAPQSAAKSTPRSHGTALCLRAPHVRFDKFSLADSSSVNVGEWWLWRILLVVSLHLTHVTECVVEVLIDLFTLLVGIQVWQLLTNFIDEGVKMAGRDLQEQAKNNTTVYLTVQFSITLKKFLRKCMFRHILLFIIEYINFN